MTTITMQYHELPKQWRWNSDKTVSVIMDGKYINSYWGIRPNELKNMVKQKFGLKRVKSSVTTMERG